MTIKDILLPLTSYPTPTQKCAIESAVALAATMGALVEAVAFEVNVQSPVGLYADPIGVAGIFAADRKKSADNAHQLLDAFEAIVKGAGIAHERRLLGCRLLEIPEQLAREARLCDLTMVPLRGPDASEQDIAEQLVFESGRPVLVFPEDPDRMLPASLDNVAVAWDFSPPAARAVADALPFLRRAKRVRVFTVIDDKPIDKSHSVARLVMGAYGHSRIREFILGGATKSILLHPPTWVLLSH
jgi:nucleotide-binding universal stress UspA family protein